MSHKVRIRLLNGLLAVLAGCVIFSGFAYPLHYGRGLWPFNHDWFMFCDESPQSYQLQAVGEVRPGVFYALDVSRYFNFTVGREGNRFQEIPRRPWVMKKLARYLCRHSFVRSVTLTEFIWPRPPGRPLTRQEVDPAKVKTITLVN